MSTKQSLFYKASIIELALFAFVFTACPTPTSPSNNSGTTVPGSGEGELPTVTSVTVSPGTAAVVPGQTQQFTATVAGTNNPNQTVTWRVEGGGSGTGISTGGLLSVAADETALMLTVRATSTVDIKKSGTASVTTSAPVNWEVYNMTTWADAHYGITTGGNGKTHIITFTDDVTIPSTAVFTNTFAGVKDITIIMQGNKTVTTSDSGYLFLIGASGLNQTVVVRDLTLQGRNNNTTSVIDIWTGGTFRMEGSAKITGNTNHSSSYDNSAGGVRVAGGTFLMQDEAEISGNTVSNSGTNREASGGGVYLSSGSFIMRDNARVECNSSSISFSVNSAYGGGVYVYSGTFTMEGGSVSNNEVRGGSYGNARGGGIYIDPLNGGTFTMYDGTISENNVTGTSVAWGGGVFGSFTMESGIISENTVSAINTSSSGVVEARGGGISGNLTIHSGTISNNSVIAGRTWGSNSDVCAFGGGVYGTLNMSGGTISGNTVWASNDVNPDRISASGGGVRSVWNFSKTGGTIYGNYEADGLRNVAIGGKGHAIYYVELGGTDKWRNATTGPSDNSARLDFWLNEIDITYSVLPDASLSSLIFTFSENPGNLLASHITLSENVSRGYASLTGSGTTRTLSPVTISGNGIITISILSMYKVETGFKDVFIIPDTPTSVSANPSASTVKLTWDPVSLATGYRVYRSTNISGPYTNIGTTTFTSHVDIELLKSRTYYYRVTAYNNAGESDPVQLSATTMEMNLLGQAIASSSNTIVIEWYWDWDAELSMELTNLAIEFALSWSPVSTSINFTYTVERRSENEPSWKVIVSNKTLQWVSISYLSTVLSIIKGAIEGVDTYYVDTGRNPNTTYDYRVYGELQFSLDVGIPFTPIGITLMNYSLPKTSLIGYVGGDGIVSATTLPDL